MNPEQDFRFLIDSGNLILKPTFNCGELDQWTTLPPGLLVQDQPISAGAALIKLYDQLADEKTLPPLITSLAKQGTREEVTAQTCNQAAQSHHLGHMTNRFPLGPTQRTSTRAVLQLRQGQLAAINGPPGTGKTTLVQSLVASLWVKSALEGTEPPVIVACSTNNQAVTNVLDSLASASDTDQSSLARRWFDPDLDSLGLFFPAFSKVEASSQRLCALPGSPWQGLPAEMENTSYVETATERYLASARDHFGEPSIAEAQEVVDLLHEELKSEAQKLAKHLDAARELTDTRERYADVDLLATKTELQREIKARQREIDNRKRLASEVESEIDRLPLVEDMLSFLGPLKDRRDDRLLRPFINQSLERPALPNKGFREELRALCKHLLAGSEAKLAESEKKLMSLAGWDAAEASFHSAVELLAAALPSNRVGATNDEIIEQPRLIEHLLDMGPRRRLFQLAARYWEGRWLLEMEQILNEDPGRLQKQSRKMCLARFRRFAKITPLLVATLYRLPRVFDYFRGESCPLLEAIDWLIVDEAGQVCPEIGAAPFALAKRAVVIGDTWQIEPIWGIREAVDLGNMELAGFATEALESEGGMGLRPSQGSLMKMAQRSSRYTAEGREDGLWLREHRRSVPKIIEYCNQLVYRGQLEALRPPVDNHPFPAMGWAHVDSPSKLAGTSRLNAGHADAIADWLHDRRQELETFYGRKLAEIVGIVTPYRPQVDQIRKSLRARNLPVAYRGMGGIDVGTVHVFQGAERPVMLFSPTVTRKDPSGYFFDRGFNMLNVAVSRARDSFLVFGDMEIFNPKVATPSGLLAKHLFKRRRNELAGVLASPELAQLPRVERIDSHQVHHELLCQALETSRNRVLVVSPYLGKTLEADGLLDLFRQTTARGVHCTVAYCKDIGGFTQAKAPKWVKRLQQTGAVVHGLSRIHNKTLAVDSDWIVEGSFNWLSAVRDPSAATHRLEVSHLSRLPEAEDFIQRAWDEVESRRSKKNK